LPEVHSHDHLNKQNEVDIDPVLRDRWKERFEALVKEEREEDRIEWKFVIVDGFLLYWDPVSSGAEGGIRRRT
jgi:nicotinamide/nicotinate riboside kinase